MQQITANHVTRSLALAIAAAALPHAASAAVLAPGYDCQTIEIPATPKTHVLKAPNGSDLPGVMCGSAVSFTFGESVSISLELGVPGFGSVGSSHGIDFSTSFTVNSQPCSRSRAVVVDTGGKYKVQICKGWWFWEDDIMINVSYQPGTLTFGQTNETSNEISCLCKELGNDCLCESIRPKVTTTQLPGSAFETNSTSFDLQQLRHGDTTGFAVKGLDSLCRLELRMLSTVLEGVVTTGVSEKIVLTSPDGSIETYPTATFLARLEELEAQMVESDELRDVNRDGKINEGDAQVILENMGATLSAGGFDLRADLDGDAMVTDADLEIWFGN